MAKNHSPRILMVCLGNICRSPLAEGIFRQKCIEAGIYCRVESAGTGSWHIGQPPHPLAQKVAIQNNIDISGQRARQFSPKDFEEFDSIFFMDLNNKRDAKKMAGKFWNESKASLLLDALGQPGILEVPDPYFGDYSGYEEVFSLISEACEKIIIDLKTRITR